MRLGATGKRLLGKRSGLGRALEDAPPAARIEDELTKLIQYPVVLSATQPEKCDPTSRVFDLSVPELDTRV